MSETPMNKLRALCEKWKREVYDYNPVACAAELEACLPDVERLVEALRKMLLYAYHAPNCAQNTESERNIACSCGLTQIKARAARALALLDQPVAPKETK